MFYFLVITAFMKTWKWILISLASLAVVGGGAGWFALQSLLKDSLSKESIVQQLEAKWNCRVALEDFKAELTSSPARLVLTNLSVAPRSDEVAKPLAQRAPIPEGTGYVHVDSATLDVDLTALLQKKVHIKKLFVWNCYVRDDVTTEGVSQLAELFQPPPSTAVPTAADVAPVAATKTEPAKEVSAAVALAGVATAEPEGVSGMSYRVEEVLLQGVKVHLRNRQSKTVNDIDRLRLRISDVDVALADLAAHNRAKIEISGQVTSTGRARVGEVIKDVPVANFAFSGQGEVKPYDLATKTLNPEATLIARLDKGSVFGGTTTVGQAAAKDKTFQQMKKNFGIDVSDVVLGGALQEEVVIDVNLKNSRVTFAKDTRLSFPDYVVTLRQGSWLNAAQDDHESHLLLVPSEPVANKIMDGVKAKMGDGLSATALGIFNDGKGKLAFDIISTEKLSKPKFKLGGQAGQIEQLFKGFGGGLLKGLLNQ